MPDILHLPQPSIADYAAACAVCQEQWPQLAPLSTPARYEAFRQFGVELVVAVEAGRIQGVSFLLPDCHTLQDAAVHFVWLFEITVRAAARASGLATKMVTSAMSVHPTILGLGVTPPAARLYDKLHWRHYDDVWRCVHVLDPRRAAAKMHGRSVLARAGVAAGSALYTAANSCWEALLGMGTGFTSPSRFEWNGEAPFSEWKIERIGTYLNLGEVRVNGYTTRTVLRADCGRIVSDGSRGIARLRAHARLWRELRDRGAVLLEYIETSQHAARRALMHGYIPMRMPLYYCDTTGTGPALVSALLHNHFTFGSCDKII